MLTNSLSTLIDFDNIHVDNIYVDSGNIFATEVQLAATKALKKLDRFFISHAKLDRLLLLEKKLLAFDTIASDDKNDVFCMSAF